QQRDWQGAIERALGGLLTTLLVPDETLSRVTRWLNRRHTGLHVRLQVAGGASGQVRFRPRGFLPKLQWRRHPYRDWLKGHLARFDLDCVADTAELDRTPFSMTCQGLIQREAGRFDKQDQYPVDDRRHWQLGFSNRTRLALLREQGRQLAGRIQEQSRLRDQAREAMNALGGRQGQWERLGRFRWEGIDLPRWRGRAEQLQQDIEALARAGGELAAAERRWQEAKSHQQVCQQTLDGLGQQLGAKGSELDKARQNRQVAARQAEGDLEEPVSQRLERRVGQLRAGDLPRAEGLRDHHGGEIDRQRQRQQEHYQQAGRRAVAIMARFRQGWPAVASDWGSDLDALGDYLHFLERLHQEGLPELVERFRERLNRHTTQSLARIRNRIDTEREDIQDRIETINGVLARTEFRAGSYLRLGVRSQVYAHVRDFNRRLGRVLAEADSDDHEGRFARLQEVITTLDKASQVDSARTLESLRLLDARYQLSFLAEELDSRDGTVRDVLHSSSGKSGGEKESFAGTIVAASLAYVLTPDGCQQPVYSTVFLDEAFSNTAEAVSRRVLRVFRELKIHVNLITPFKNLNLARESARSLLIAERDPHRHESRLCELTWEELDRQMEAAESRRAKTQAAALGIQFES
ncbi:MAG: SbcC/MukB-like Walker B domain-containing protein, partial [Candidatus Competibacteraceae bacterium]|nr:SbcC/MukB-like Walker B domain-containing protein [Candidatus Competibacteraceae bacterium]